MKRMSGGYAEAQPDPKYGKSFFGGRADLRGGAGDFEWGRLLWSGCQNSRFLVFLILILVSVLLTGWNIYPRIGKFAGAGALGSDHRFPPILWRASAIEYQKEGQVFASDVRFLPLPGRLSCMGFSVPGCWALSSVF